MMKVFLLLILPFISYSQSVELSIIDMETKSPIQNAKIMQNNKPIGSSNSQGKLLIPISYKVIDVTALGFDTVEVVLGGLKQNVYLSKVDKKIKEIKIVMRSDSFALFLVDKMKSKFESNHPDRLPSYRFYVYSKFTADAKPDTAKTDTTKSDSTKKKNLSKKDSLERNEMNSFIQHSKLFVWEKATVFKHDLNFGNKKVLLNSKMSGFKQPIYELLAMSLDDVNTIPRVYREKNSKEYYFKFDDSLMLNGRKTYQISFFPMKKYKTKRSRSGYTLIDAENYAMMKYQGTTKEGFAEIHNQLIEGKCFSKEVFYNYTDVFFQVESFKSTTTYHLKVDSIRVPFTFSKSEFKGNENEISSSLNDNSSSKLLSNLRGSDTLDSREANTYQSLDSIIDRENIQTKLKLLLALRRGYVRLGKYFNLSVNDLIQDNRYEGFRPQLGGTTSYELHPKLGFNGYLAYGLKDNAFKYGLGITYLTDYYSNSKLSINYQNDVLPVGRSIHELSNPAIKFSQIFNSIYFSNYIQSQNIKLGFQTDIHKYLEAKISTQYSEISNLFDYKLDGSAMNSTKWSSSTISLRYYPKSQYVTTPEGKFEVDLKPTQFLFRTSFHTPLSQNYYYSSYLSNELEATSSLKSIFGRSNFTFMGGYNLGNAPIFGLYEGRGSSKTNDQLSKTFMLSSDRYFTTMEPGSFYSDKYTCIFFNHSLPRFKIKEKLFFPNLVYKAMIGEISNPNSHLVQNQYIQSPHKIYQEAGLEFHNIFALFGVGAYYRFGAYHIGEFSNNLAFRLVTSF